MGKVCFRLFRLQGHYYLLIVDYYSKFIAVEKLQTPQSETVINKCKKLFTQFGIPKELITDNDPEFSSHKFRLFSKTWDTLHKLPPIKWDDPFKLLNEPSAKQNLILKNIFSQCYP